MYMHARHDSNVTVVHKDSPDKYTVVATVATMRGAKTISVDQVMHVAYLFQPEYGPAPAAAPGSPPPGGRGPRDRKSTRLNSSHVKISYAVFCLKKKKQCGHQHE